MSQKKGARKKTLRYLRWSVKIAFLLIFILPVKFFPDPGVYRLPVYSLTVGGLAQPPLYWLDYGQSVCSLILISWSYLGPGAWLVCPVGGLEVLLTAGNAPASGLQLSWLLLSLASAVLLFFVLIFLLGSIFCSWVCPLGTVIDGFDKGVERFMPKTNLKREERLKRNREKNEQKSRFACPTCPFGKFLANKNVTVANGLLVTALVGSAILRFPLWCSICPIGILSQGMFHLKAWTKMTGKMMPLILEFWAIPVIAVLLSLREKRYWCRKICPLGALVKFGARFNPFLKPTAKVDKPVMKEDSKTCEDDRCASCSNLDSCECNQIDQKTCENVCPQAIGPLRAKGSAECIKCLDCYIECKNDAIEIKRFGTPDAVLWLRRLFKKLKRRLKKQKS